MAENNSLQNLPPDFTSTYIIEVITVDHFTQIIGYEPPLDQVANAPVLNVDKLDFSQNYNSFYISMF